jgi:hypothetical protein
MPSKSDSSATTVEVATVPSARRFFHPWLLWVAALGAIGTVLGAVWIWRRRTRSVEETSLITESIDRRKD